MIEIILTLVIVGVVLYLINLLPMDGTIKQIIRVLIILLVVIWLLQSLGILGSLRIR